VGFLVFRLRISDTGMRREGGVGATLKSEPVAGLSICSSSRLPKPLHDWKRLREEDARLAVPRADDDEEKDDGEDKDEDEEGGRDPSL